MDQATRLRRREEARRRVRRQRRRAALGVAALLLVGVAVPVLTSGGRSALKRDAVTHDAPPQAQLPRGGRAIFPSYRVVAFYGAPQDPALGALGIGTPDQAVRRLVAQARPYGSGRKVLPALELISVVASSDSYGGRYSMRLGAGTIRRYLNAARRARALLLLDIQPGRADFMAEVRRLQPFLEQPDVGLALDPEWRVGPGQVPGKVIGSMDAREVNAISAWLAGIVKAHRLPEKLLVVHQFTDHMVANRRLLLEPPGVALTLNVDGFGSVPVKIAKYRDLARAQPRTHHGLKLFYEEDPVLMKPREVLRLRPRPELVVYE